MNKYILICITAIVCFVASCALCLAGQPQDTKIVSCVLTSDSANKVIVIPEGYVAVRAYITAVSSGDEKSSITVLVSSHEVVVPLPLNSKTRITMEHEQGSIPVLFMPSNASITYVVNIEIECTSVSVSQE